MAHRQLTAAQHRLLATLVGRISSRLELAAEEPIDTDGQNARVTLRERGQSVTLEVPFALLEQAETDATAREALRIRLKSRRDRMLFRPPPAPLPKSVVQSRDSVMPRGFGGPRGGGRR